MWPDLQQCVAIFKVQPSLREMRENSKLKNRQVSFFFFFSAGSMKLIYVEEVIKYWACQRKAWSLIFAWSLPKVFL